MTNKEKQIDTKKNPLVFYDGVCGLCNRSVWWIIKHDKEEKFLFATLQGDLAQKWLNSAQREGMGSVILVCDESIYTESAAAFRIARLLKGWPRMLAVFSVLPRFITDGVYRFIARNRYKWFGKMDTCPFPDAGVRHRFLDEFNS